MLEIRGEEIDKKNLEIQELYRKLRDTPNARRRFNLDEIKRMSPSDEFVRQLKQMVLGGEPPFRETLNALTVGISVVDLGGRGPLYTVCPDTPARRATSIIEARGVARPRSGGDDEAMRAS